MGNIGSHSSGLINQRADEQQWAHHSFPRAQGKPARHPHPHQPQIVPDHDARQKLRPTNNGEILQSGGTLSGRQQSRFSLGEEYNSTKQRTLVSDQRDPLHKAAGARLKQNTAEYKNAQNTHRDKMKRVGSEPDLRHSMHSLEKNDARVKAKKKYKAPPPPPPPPPPFELQRNVEWPVSTEVTNNRRGRIFKTRVESSSVITPTQTTTTINKRNHSSPVNNLESSKVSGTANDSKTCCMTNDKRSNDDFVQMRRECDTRGIDLRSNRFSLPEMKIAGNFHQELKEATKRLRQADTHNLIEKLPEDKSKLKTLDHSLSRNHKNASQINTVDERSKNFGIREECSGKESSSPDQSSSPVTIRNKANINEPKSFYFGMNEEMQDYSQNNVHIPKIQNSSESELSSEIECDQVPPTKYGIDLQLRPILPKKQLEIPRFSPAAAWKQLSAVDGNKLEHSSTTEEVSKFIEDKIEKSARVPPPLLEARPRSNDKSGDSGISGDAGPVVYDENPDAIMNRKNTFKRISWTPQQDLGDDSSLEEDLNNEDDIFNEMLPNKPHIFSLSLPRDNHISNYIENKQGFTSLQKIKHIGVMVNQNVHQNVNRKDLVQPVLPDQNDNWFLSKSAPNSLNNNLNSFDVRSSHHSDESSSNLMGIGKHPTGRLVYLPEFDRSNRLSARTDSRERSRSVERSNRRYKLASFSKSCDALNNDSNPFATNAKNNERVVNFTNSGKKSKRFTFQSTVRQIERKRIADKLSREAEIKEMQRLREAAAMQQVEEEFQKKRANEKANIRQQLRMFSSDDNNSSMISDLKIEMRPEPDGAVSSSATSSPSLPPTYHQSSEQSRNKVFQKNKKINGVYNNANSKHRPSSESSEDTRTKPQIGSNTDRNEYRNQTPKEYSSRCFLGDVSAVKQTTVHPQITCNMPKAKGQSSNKLDSGVNYRKGFAHGVKVTKSLMENGYQADETQSRNNSHRVQTHISKYTPIARF